MIIKLSAEFVGTFWLVLGGCGSAVLAAAFPEVGIGLLGVSLAFGLTVVTGAYALGPISGGHFNPAVSVGLWAGGRFPTALLLPYTVAQVLGGIGGACVLYFIASGRADFNLAGGFASNGYGVHSPGGYSLSAGLVCEVVMTFMFLVVILGTTHKRALGGFAGLAILAIGVVVGAIAGPNLKRQQDNDRALKKVENQNDEALKAVEQYERNLRKQRGGSPRSTEERD